MYNSYEIFIYYLFQEVLNFDTWIYNLTEANLNPDKPPRWFKEYSFKSRFELEDLSLESLDQLLKKFASNSEQLLTKASIFQTIL